MVTRFCIRGCTREHLSACESFGPRGSSACRGCAPSQTVGKSLVCRRCLNRLRAMITATPDMLAHLRALTNPIKGTQYDREPSAGAKVLAPPPVPVELLDAADFVTTLLWSTQCVVRGVPPVGRMQVPVAATAVDMLAWSQGVRDEILAGLFDLAHREEIGKLLAAVLDAPREDEWTLVAIFKRWSMDEPPWWAAQPCPMPACGLRAVEVTPAKIPGDETKYECKKCGWHPQNDDDGFWAESFSRREGKAA